MINNLSQSTKEKVIKSMGKTINESSRSELTTKKVLLTTVMSIYSQDYEMAIIKKY